MELSDSELGELLPNAKPDRLNLVRLFGLVGVQSVHRQYNTIFVY